VNTRRKGVEFEREVAALFEAAGYSVRGLESGGDHFAIALGGALYHVEAKRQERLQLPLWLAQQDRDCPATARRLLVFKQSHRPIYVVEPLDQHLRDTHPGGR